jgi:hypothetical protein
MAITPNTDFSSGAVLTAQQQNNFPRGIMSFVERTTSVTPVTTEQVILTLPSFTAVANRYYKVTGFLPYNEQTAGAVATFSVKIRKGTTTAGTQLQESVEYATATASDDKFMFIQWVGTLTAGAQQMVLTFTASANTLVLASATVPAQFIIEDIGTA